MAEKPMDKIERGFHLIHTGIKEGSGPDKGFRKFELEFIRDMSKKIHDDTVKVLDGGPSKK